MGQVEHLAARNASAVDACDGYRIAAEEAPSAPSPRARLCRAASESAPNLHRSGTTPADPLLILW
jgi:hypothetical protein